LWTDAIPLFRRPLLSGGPDVAPPSLPAHQHRTDFINAHNDNPQGFTWTAPVQRLLDKVHRAQKLLDKI
jgi:hypothetical protein